MENPFELILEKLNKLEKDILEIKEIKYHAASGINSNELMNIQQVAEYLSLSVPTLYGYTSHMEIPHMKRNKRLYFRKAEIDEWLLKSRRKTREEIEKKADNYTRRRK
ncbi:MAG: helix-turn-helix domain-containing protein [Chitinophagaceae bacterium]|nr:helix-turn-helix domain-containing protein [Chitinophagaceae bacterium]